MQTNPKRSNSPKEKISWQAFQGDIATGKTTYRPIKCLSSYYLKEKLMLFALSLSK